MKRNNILFVLFALFFLSLDIMAQEDRYYSEISAHLHYKSFSLEEGLSNPNVTCFATDGQGVLWVGTDMGLNRIVNGNIFQLLHYDTENGYYDIGHVDNIACGVNSRIILVSTENGLLSHVVGSDSFNDVLYENEKIFPDAVYTSDESALILANQNGKTIILEYDFISESLSLFYELKGVGNYSFTRILKVRGDDNAILLVDSRNGFFRLDTQSWKLSKIVHIGGNINAKAIYQDMFGTLWVAYENNGVVGYQPDRNYLKYKVFNTDNSPLPHNNVTSITETVDCFLCLATDGGGIVLIDKQYNLFRLAQHHYIIQSNCITRLGENLLVGTPHHGLVLVKEHSICVLSNNNLNEHSRFNNSVVLSFCQDKDAVWCGTVNGISRYDELNKFVTNYPSTESMQIIAIAELDTNSLLFFSLYDKFYIFDKTTGNISPFPIENIDRNHLSSGYHNLLMCRASNNNIYLANCNGKHYVYNCLTNRLTEFSLAKDDDNADGKIVSIMRTSNGVLLTTLNSIYEISGNSATAHCLYKGTTRIYSSSVDANNNLWFVNDDGLSMYNYLFKEINLVFPSLPDSYYSTFLIDRIFNKIWLVTQNNRLLVYDNNTKIYHFYSQEDGLAFRNKYYSNTFCSDNGLLYFPGSSGLTVIRPFGTMQALRTPRPMHVLYLKIDSKDPVQLSDNDSYKFPSHYSEALVHIALEQQNTLFSTDLRYTVKKGSKVVIENETTDPFLKLNNLGSGRYVLFMQMFSKDGWSEPEKIFSFRVPFSSANIFIVLTGIIILVVIIIAQIMYFRRKGNANFNTEILKTRKETARHYVMRMNTLLYGMLHKNITTYHNIVNNLNKILGGSALTNEQSKNINYLKRYVEHSINNLSLINEANNPLAPKTTFEIEQVNFSQWLDGVLSGYKILAKLNSIELKTVYDPHISTVNIDKNKTEAVIGVLLDNAIKFSTGGQIKVVTSYSSLGNIKLSVIDEGCGIQGDADAIFNPSVNDNSDIAGTGLSLHSVKVIIERMGGSAGAYNNQNKGATFFLYIPTTLKADSAQNSTDVVGQNHDAAQAVKPESECSERSIEQSETEQNSGAEENVVYTDVDPFVNQYTTINPDVEFNTLGYTLLVVDDQQDNLDFLQEEYADLFKEIYVAHDGVEGLEKIHKHYPSIIVSDILMPRMNGFEMCKAVKSDLDISHLPVVLLTSRNDSSFQDVGYKLGADAFVPKPFDTKMLYNILKTQLRNRFEIKRQYAITGLPEITEEYTFSLADEKFVKKLNQYINDNISNPDLNVDMMVEHMCVSRSTLFNKMRSLCGVTSNKYIRKIRIERAKELLSKTDRSVFEIAIDTGFTESQYFSTVFKQETGCTPSQYRTNLEKNEKTDS